MLAFELNGWWADLWRTDIRRKLISVADRTVGRLHFLFDDLLFFQSFLFFDDFQGSFANQLINLFRLCHTILAIQLKILSSGSDQ